MARKRTGSLMLCKSGYRARVWVMEDGTEVRRFIDIGTTNKSVAKRKLARLVARIAKGLPPEDVEVEATRYSVNDFAEKYYDERSNHVKSWKDERRIYDTCLAPKIGTSGLDHVTAQDI